MEHSGMILAKREHSRLEISYVIYYYVIDTNARIITTTFLLQNLRWRINQHERL